MPQTHEIVNDSIEKEMNAKYNELMLQLAHLSTSTSSYMNNISNRVNNSLVKVETSLNNSEESASRKVKILSVLLIGNILVSAIAILILNYNISEVTWKQKATYKNFMKYKKEHK